MLLEDGPSGVKFVFVDDDWRSGRQNGGLVAPEESAKRQETRKRSEGSKAGYGHRRGYVRLALDANSAHEFILDTRFREPQIRGAPKKSSDGTYHRFRARELGEWTPVFECKKEYLADWYVCV